MDFFFKDNTASHHWAFIYLLLIKMIDSFANNMEKGSFFMMHTRNILPLRDECPYQKKKQRDSYELFFIVDIYLNSEFRVHEYKFTSGV